MVQVRSFMLAIDMLHLGGSSARYLVLL